ncbi:MAG: hypothetical protein RBR32_03620 [Bacteroidales bacterium]|nr:hypothetical protein [Bacteroidales bacterium]
MFKIGNSIAIGTWDLERLNRNEKYLKKLKEEIRKEILTKKDGRKRWMDKDIPIPEEIRATIVLQKETYVELQDLLEDLTGKVWKMDEFLKLMIDWFVYYYDDEEIETKKMPLVELEKPKTKENKNLKKFEERFEKHFKNIMGEFK